MTHTEYETGVWYGWNGGECPVGSKSVVDITYADGSVRKDKTAWHMKWDEPLLFRIVTPYVEPEPKLECWVWRDQSGGLHAVHKCADIQDAVEMWGGTWHRMIEAEDKSPINVTDHDENGIRTYLDGYGTISATIDNQ